MMAPKDNIQTWKSESPIIMYNSQESTVAIGSKKFFLFIYQVSTVTRNMATNKPIAITAKKVEENIDTLCPQVGDYLSQ